MTVSPRRPQDVNRRPSRIKIDPAHSSTLPPILFQLPRLSRVIANGDEPKNGPSEPEPEIDQIPQSLESSDENESYQDAEIETVATATVTTSDEDEKSFLQRLGTHVVMFGMLALAVAWVVIVVKNVNLESTQVAQADGEDASEFTSEDLAMTQTEPTASPVRGVDFDATESVEHEIAVADVAVADAGVPEVTQTPAVQNPAMQNSTAQNSEELAPLEQIAAETEPTMVEQPGSAEPAMAVDSNTLLAEPTVPATDTLSVDQLAVSQPSAATLDQSQMQVEAANSDPDTSLPSVAELNAELHAALAAGHIKAAPASTQINKQHVEANNSDAAMDDVTPIPTAQSMTPNGPNVAKYAQVVSHSTPESATPAKTYSRTPQGIQDWTRYLPALQQNNVVPVGHAPATNQR